MILDHQGLAARGVVIHARSDVSFGMLFDRVYKVIRDSTKRMRSSILGMSERIFTHVGFIENAWNYVPLQLRSVCFLLDELIYSSKSKLFPCLFIHTTNLPHRLFEKWPKPPLFVSSSLVKNFYLTGKT
jgi:hypothetical protein